MLLKFIGRSSHVQSDFHTSNYRNDYALPHGSTSNLQRHIKTKHLDKLQAVGEDVNIAKASVSFKLYFNIITLNINTNFNHRYLALQALETLSSNGLSWMINLLLW